MRLHYPSGSLSTDDDAVAIDHEKAGWEYSGLKVFDVRPGETRRLSLKGLEGALIPLQGSCSVEGSGYRFDFRSRTSVFDSMPDACYLPLDDDVGVSSNTGARIALASSVATESRSARFLPATATTVEIRGAGQATRQINPILSAAVDGPQSLIVVEVLAPGGNWSSYPPHKHDEWSENEVPVEEIYYFEIRDDDAAGGGFGLHRTYTADGEIDETVEVRSGDVFLVPRGYHGPCVAAPGYDMYYLNVMAGPDPERRWMITTDPAYAWLWEEWKTVPKDPRVPLYR
jgi:5-deoxy-glucuronate isomerase